MRIYTYRNSSAGKELELATNNDGCGLFVRGRDGSFLQMAGNLQTPILRDATTLRRFIRNQYPGYLSGYRLIRS